MHQLVVNDVRDEHALGACLHGAAADAVAEHGEELLLVGALARGRRVREVELSERVLQIGSAKGIGRLLQRAGRSGHRPSGVPRVTLVPTHALELVEVPMVKLLARVDGHDVEAALERLGRELAGMAEVTWSGGKHLLELSAPGITKGVTLAEVAEMNNRLVLGVEAAEFQRMLSGPHDRNSCFISINPGAGGTESQDWASMLLRMYLRWTEQRGFSTDMVEASPGEEAGLKSTTFTVKVTDANSATATATFSLTVNDVVTATQAIASKSLTKDQSYTAFTPVTASGGTTPGSTCSATNAR